MLALFLGWLMGVNGRNLGWTISKKIVQVASMVMNHGFGFSWGMSLRGAGCLLSLA